MEEVTSGLIQCVVAITMTTRLNLLQAAHEQLVAVTDQPLLEAEILLQYVLGVSRSHLRAWPEQAVTIEQARLFQSYVARRLQKEPIPYITGQHEFWSLPLAVTTATLIPRPETELLVEKVLTLFPDKQSAIRLADLGTGSGAIALALASERSNWGICAVDVSQSALQIASENAQTLGLKNISFYLGSWCTALPDLAFNVIVSNPPYIAETEWADYAAGLQFEPRSALVAGADGLDDIRTIISDAKRYLLPGGYLLIEHGYQQAKAVQAIFLASGYQQVDSMADLAGHWRVTMGVK
jgi:release factor glutamine methyltransferase